MRKYENIQNVFDSINVFLLTIHTLTMFQNTVFKLWLSTQHLSLSSRCWLKGWLVLLFHWNNLANVTPQSIIGHSHINDPIGLSSDHQYASIQVCFWEIRFCLLVWDGGLVYILRIPWWKPCVGLDWFILSLQMDRSLNASWVHSDLHLEMSTCDRITQHGC